MCVYTGIVKVWGGACEHVCTPVWCSQRAPPVSFLKKNSSPTIPELTKYGRPSQGKTAIGICLSASSVQGLQALSK